MFFFRIFFPPRRLFIAANIAEKEWLIFLTNSPRALPERSPLNFNKLPTNKLLCTSFVHSRRELNQLKSGLEKTLLVLLNDVFPLFIKGRYETCEPLLIFIHIFISCKFWKYYEKKTKNWKTEANSLEHHRLPLETNVFFSFRDPVFSGSVRFTQHDSSGKGNSFPPDMLHTLVRLITRGTYIYGVNMSWQTCLSRWGKVSSLLRRLRIPSFE